MNSERKALDWLCRDVMAADAQPGLDMIDAAVVARMTPGHLQYTLDRQRRDAAPHGRCPACGEPLTHEPRSVEWYEYAGAQVAQVFPAWLGCDECGVLVEEAVV